MKVIIAAVGKENDFAGSPLVKEYLDRAGHYAPCEMRYIAPGDQKSEHAKLMSFLDGEKGSYVIALDERGKGYTSKSFAEKMQSLLNQGTKSLVLVIGGSYGLSDELRGRADAVMSLSDMTFPHQLARLFIAEQLYRAFTIMRGEKYHH